MKVGFMARIALQLILSCMAASAASAQDAVPETPPELRDFRLDPERPAPEPQPQPEVQPPPAVPTVEPEAPAAQPRAERPAPSRAAEQPAGTSAPEVNRSFEPLPQVEGEPQPEAFAPPEDITPSPASEVIPDPTLSSASLWWQVAAALAAAFALLGGWLLFRRYRRDGTGSKEREPVKAVIACPRAHSVNSPGAIHRRRHQAPANFAGIHS